MIISPREVFADDAVDGPPISVRFPSNRPMATKVRVFIDFVAEVLAHGQGTSPS